MVPRIIVLVAVLCVAQGAVLRYDPDLFDWEVFKQVHVKNYITELEEALRKEIFYRNTKVIIRHNEEFAAGKHTYNMGVNKYTDLEHKEFVRLMNGYKGHARNVSKAASEGSTYLSPMFVKLPDSVDWRKKGAVTPVKDQGQCGSCWSFSTTGSLEGQHFRKTKKLVSLSEQNLVDCSAKYGNEGCNGGLMDQAFKYIKDNGGIDTEESYPYTAQQGDCMFKKSTIGANDTGFVDVTSGDEEKLAEAIATVGPVSIAIDASHQSFQFYKKGVYVEPECSSSQLDHGVLIVGYGSSKDGSDYWIVKNSWSTSWGDEGYVMMARNKDNQCGVATQASYPLV